MEDKGRKGEKAGKAEDMDKKKQNDKKEKCIIFALAGILLLIVCLPVKQKEETKNNTSYSNEKNAKITSSQEKEGQTGAIADANGADSYVEGLEQELEALLQCMEGAGKVRVMITLKSTSEEIVEKDRPANRSNTAENDGAGGSRSINDMDSEEETVFITDSEGRQIPYVRKTMQPVVEGVAVLAEGGGKETVRQNISETIQALFGIDANKIKIAKMKTVK